PPYQGGGDMIKMVSFEKTIYNALPYKFEAGTPHIAGAIGLATALDYIAGLGLDSIAAWEHELLVYGTELLQAVPGVRLIGTARRKAAVLSFVLDGVHAHDLGTILDHQGVAVRAGHHCAMPVMDRFGVPATVRASLGLYHTRAEREPTASVIGKPLDEAEALFHRIHAMLTGEATSTIDAAGDGLGKLAVFAGVREFPSRIKCATLAWHTLRSALSGAAEPVSTE